MHSRLALSLWCVCVQLVFRKQQISFNIHIHTHLRTILTVLLFGAVNAVNEGAILQGVECRSVAPCQR